MANLTETPVYTDSIFRIETDTPVQGGPIVLNSSGVAIAGFDNLQAQQLANRTSYLKQELTQVPTLIEAAISPLVESIGEANGICNLDSSGLVPLDKLGNVPPGELTTADNLGIGEGVYSAKVGSQLQFKSVKVVNNLVISSTDDEITIDGEHQHNTNQITGFGQAVDDRVVDLITAGSNITVTYDSVANSLEIAASAAVGGGVDVQEDGAAVAPATALNFTGNVSVTNTGAGVVEVEVLGSSASGDVVGPVSSVDNSVALFDGSTGKLLKDGGVLGDSAFSNVGVDVQAWSANLDSWSALETSSKQDTLVSGTNIKTINGSSLLGTGNITISGGSSTIDASNISDFTAEVNNTYWLGSSLTVTLPNVTPPIPVGSFVEFVKKQTETPIIMTLDGTQILVNGQSDTSVTYNLNARIIAVFNGTAWEI